jgi:hypothetical protein
VEVLGSATAFTPQGRLINILRAQKVPLFALLDAAREPKVPSLVRESGHEHQSLYDGDAYAAVAPYLVSLPPSTTLLTGLVNDGWGRGWSLYLTCPLQLKALRGYFRSSLMVTTPDGREFFSRFYDPRFFRGFLPGCNPAEAEKFFGPVASYFMEAENADVLLQFTRSKRGVEKRERVLLVSGT